MHNRRTKTHITKRMSQTQNEGNNCHNSEIRFFKESCQYSKPEYLNECNNNGRY